MSRLTLFCLPNAGGSAMNYSRWWRGLAPDIDLQPIELAGRGRRFHDKLYDSVEEAVEDIYRKIKDRLDLPYAIFGHSMGSLLAFELIYKIKQKNGIPPVHFFASGRKAPQCPHDKTVMYTLPEADFRNKLLELGGTPREVLDNDELAQMFLPLIRSDYKIVETYAYRERDCKINCGITVLNGTRDSISKEHLQDWAFHSNGNDFNIVHFEGGHFFIHERMESVVELVNRTLIGIITTK